MEWLLLQIYVFIGVAYTIMTYDANKKAIVKHIKKSPEDFTFILGNKTVNRIVKYTPFVTIIIWPFCIALDVFYSIKHRFFNKNDSE